MNKHDKLSLTPYPLGELQLKAFLELARGSRPRMTHEWLGTD